MRIGIDARKIADFGIGTYIRGLLRGLVELGGGDEYVAFAPERLAHLVPAGVEHVAVDAPHYSLRELVVVGRAMDRARLDVAHAPHYVVPFTAVPVAVTIHDLIHLRHRNPLARLYARGMIGRAVRKSRGVLTVSEAVKRELVTEFGCRAEAVAVAPNGVDARFSPNGPRVTGRYFLFVGNDKPHKSVDLLVEAFERARIADAALVLAGATFARFEGRATLARFVGDDELPALMRGAMALVMPSREEGFGLPALEAMACGTAVITSDAAALVETTGDAALHVAPHAGALADAMARVANDEALRRALALRGVARASQFTWSRCASLTREVYHRAANSEQRAGR